MPNFLFFDLPHGHVRTVIETLQTVAGLRDRYQDNHLRYLAFAQL
jgi:hypothetical protein